MCTCMHAYTHKTVLYVPLVFVERNILQLINKEQFVCDNTVI